jgi:RNA polymerase nonessential primary-like sigma factor
LFVHGQEAGDPRLATEIPLFRHAQAGCSASLNQLMRRHDGLVQAVVRQQRLGTLPFTEALQAGRMGLWRAILGYDPQRGLAFSTYAWPAIMRQVWRAVKQHTRQQDDALQDAPLPGHATGLPQQAPDPAALTEAAAVQLALHRLLSRLPQRLHQLLLARYGLDGQPPASYRRLGARLGLSHERVRQLHTEALVWLRHPAHSQELRTLLQRHTLADYEAADVLAQRWLQQRAGRHVH